MAFVYSSGESIVAPLLSLCVAVSQESWKILQDSQEASRMAHLQTKGFFELTDEWIHNHIHRESSRIVEDPAGSQKNSPNSQEASRIVGHNTTRISKLTDECIDDQNHQGSLRIL